MGVSNDAEKLHNLPDRFDVQPATDNSNKNTNIFDNAVSSFESIQRSAQVASSSRGKKNILIVTPGIEKDLSGLQYDQKVFPHSQFTKPKDCSEKGLVNAVESYVKTVGTLDELTMDVHGSPNFFSPTSSPIDSISVKDFLDDLVQLQNRLHKKITNRIVFDACGIFVNLSPQDVEDYRRLSADLGAEIVAAKSIVRSTGGRYVVFKPDGTVRRDKLDVSFGIISVANWFDTIHEGWSDDWFNEFAPYNIPFGYTRMGTGPDLQKIPNYKRPHYHPKPLDDEAQGS